MPELVRKVPSHGFVLAAAALLGLFAPMIGGARLQTAISVLVGITGVGVLLHFGGTRRAQARAALNSSPSGRIQSRVDAQSHRIFELPGAGIEPWYADAWVVAIVALAALFLGVTADALARPFNFMLVLISGALSLRLLTVNSDHIRLETSEQGYWIQAHEGSRLIRRSGAGALSAELLPEALVLWSRDGRIGVLRGELEPGERAWLAEQLPKNQGFVGSAPDPARGEVEQPEAREDR